MFKGVCVLELNFYENVNEFANQRSETQKRLTKKAKETSKVQSFVELKTRTMRVEPEKSCDIKFQALLTLFRVKDRERTSLQMLPIAESMVEGREEGESFYIGVTLVTIPSH